MALPPFSHEPLQVNRLVDLKTFCSDPEYNKKKVQFRNDADRKKWVLSLGLKVVKNPKDNSDAVPVLDKVVMLTGLRKSAKREKQEKGHATKEDEKAAYRKAADALKIDTNSKDAWLVGWSVGQWERPDN